MADIDSQDKLFFHFFCFKKISKVFFSSGKVKRFFGFKKSQSISILEWGEEKYFRDFFQKIL
jgi:hypothetical protein